MSVNSEESDLEEWAGPTLFDLYGGRCMGRLDFLFEGLRERIETLGYKYVGTELATEGGMKILRVYADKEGGLELTDSEVIAGELNGLLDSHEASLPPRYFLEVSSPGLERPLFTPGDYRDFAGKEASLKLKGQKMVTGVIGGVSENGDVTVIRADGESLTVPFEDIRGGKLVYKPEVGEKKTFKKIQKKKNKKKN